MTLNFWLSECARGFFYCNLHSCQKIMNIFIVEMIPIKFNVKLKRIILLTEWFFSSFQCQETKNIGIQIKFNTLITSKCIYVFSSFNTQNLQLKKIVKVCEHCQCDLSIKFNKKYEWMFWNLIILKHWSEAEVFLSPYQVFICLLLVTLLVF